jgi:hypothetical protein
MNTECVDFSYEISDERLLAYSQVPLLDRLRWLDGVRRFTMMVRLAPSVPVGGATHNDETNRAALAARNRNTE